MRLLIDSDVFCKLGVAGLLEDALAALDISVSDCARLPALPYMLRRGRLPGNYGSAECERLVPLAEAISAIPSADIEWLGRLATVSDIDPGEAQLLAFAAQHTLLLLTGDKRALRAVRNVQGYPDALRRRVVVLEAALIELCARLGEVEVGRRIAGLKAKDPMLSVCFSSDNRHPTVALKSYCTSLAAEVHPLLLWEPPQRGAE
jgi:hypothetical protein